MIRKLNITEINELLKGKKITEVNGLVVDESEITITLEDGSSIRMYHSQECCEEVYVEDIVGDVNIVDSIFYEIIEKVSNTDSLPKDVNTQEYGDVEEWTFYTIKTSKGYLDIRWYGTSNGYYSTSVTVEGYIDNENLIMDSNINTLTMDEMKQIAANNGYYIYSSVGNSGLGNLEKTPTAYIDSSKFGKLDMDSFLGNTEYEVVSNCFNYVMDCLVHKETMFDDKYCNNKCYAQDLLIDYNKKIEYLGLKGLSLYVINNNILNKLKSRFLNTMYSNTDTYIESYKNSLEKCIYEELKKYNLDITKFNIHLYIDLENASTTVNVCPKDINILR